MNWKNNDDVIICRHDVTVKFFWLYHVFFFVKFSYNLSFMSIWFFVLELWYFSFDTSVRVLPNIWRLGQVRNTRFGVNIPNENVLNAAKCLVYCFYRFWFIKGKLTGKNREELKIHPFTQIRVKLKLKLDNLKYIPEWNVS